MASVEKWLGFQAMNKTLKCMIPSLEMFDYAKKVMISQGVYEQNEEEMEHFDLVIRNAKATPGG